MNLPAIDRNAVIFELLPPPLKDENLLVAVDNSEDDKFFEITAQDVANMQRLLTEKSNNEKALIPRKYLEEKNKKQRENAWKNCVIRFKLFGKYIIQALFISTEPVSNLFDFIIQNLFIGEFQLKYLMKKIEKNEINLLNANIAPKASIIIHPINNLINFDSLDELLKNTKNIKKCSEEEAELISCQWLSENSIYQPQNYLIEDNNSIKNIQENNNSQLDQDILQRREARENAPPLPKWFKKK
ncbi:hypothetical protein ACQ4LE_004773 [Meloidogyne hapla]|uniref:Uncharacterized protein n=1 Tax=Meloidogyne hapla TaxID=6305 RepID=A0A1I8BST4_MELHA